MKDFMNMPLKEMGEYIVESNYSKNFKENLTYEEIKDKFIEKIDITNAKNLEERIRLKRESVNRDSKVYNLNSCMLKELIDDKYMIGDIPVISSVALFRRIKHKSGNSSLIVYTPEVKSLNFRKINDIKVPTMLDDYISAVRKVYVFTKCERYYAFKFMDKYYISKSEGNNKISLSLELKRIIDGKEYIDRRDIDLGSFSFPNEYILEEELKKISGIVDMTYQIKLICSEVIREEITKSIVSILNKFIKK